MLSKDSCSEVSLLQNTDLLTSSGAKNELLWLGLAFEVAYSDSWLCGEWILVVAIGVVDQLLRCLKALRRADASTWLDMEPEADSFEGLQVKKAK